jgi:hypothetical protein
MVRRLGQHDDSDMDRGKSGGTRSALRAWRLSYLIVSGSEGGAVDSDGEGRQNRIWWQKE